MHRNMRIDYADTIHPLETLFRETVGDPDFPCVGAKAALNRDGMRVLIARDMASGWDDLRIHRALVEMAADYRADPQPFRSFVVLFETGAPDSEEDYEALLWNRIQSLADKDEWRGIAPDPRVSSDPDDPHFSLSFGGEAFFVVGLHPNASRPARRFPMPAMVFNLHDQFEQLRDQGRYEKLRSTILSRDKQLAGSVNPMLARHGEASEARQYSGRMVGPEWRCPFQRRSPGTAAND